MEILDLIKTVSSPDRLRIIGLLAQKRATHMEMAAQLGLSLRQAGRHLAFLEGIELVLARGTDYQLTPRALESLSHRQLEGTRSSFTPGTDLPATSEKILKGYLNADGSLKQLPSLPGKRLVILMYVIESFETGTDYTEREVTVILKRFHEDHASLRRYLVDAGLLERESDGSRYWRPLKERTS